MVNAPGLAFLAHYAIFANIFVMWPKTKNISNMASFGRVTRALETHVAKNETY